jgi:hypothetical protein
VLTPLIAPVMGYDISGPQDTLDIKKTRIFLRAGFFLGEDSFSVHSSNWKTGTDLDGLLHY